MAISQTAEYALRAVIRLAQMPEQAQTTQQLAESTRVPQSYLPKVLQPLARAGIVKAQRGSHGGYSLSREAQSLSVQEVVHCVDPPYHREACRGEGHQMCRLHQLLTDVQSVTEDRYAATSIGDLVQSGCGSEPLCNLHLDELQQIAT
ncbi:RrF2 family transcriptional regulator [Aeoliella mucimassa]|uniref:HTH-type transcriptional regulator CymR n=1 Tax=Aeoliella mucimassa TaxID=2527972 RepID=A0A518AM02_9BACT|nr:Rrf2 family transcriptional regulator [Aeoliella mucimassa]QDU55759.1 HTH-type transcriptional regulator CymR [Aeoliella mucimassa]